jgi:hypothetical protein
LQPALCMCLCNYALHVDGLEPSHKGRPHCPLHCHLPWLTIRMLGLELLLRKAGAIKSYAMTMLGDSNPMCHIRVFPCGTSFLFLLLFFSILWNPCFCGTCVFVEPALKRFF